MFIVVCNQFQSVLNDLCKFCSYEVWLLFGKVSDFVFVSFVMPSRIDFVTQ